MRRRRRPRNPIWTFTLTWLFLSFFVNFRHFGLLALGIAGLAAYIFGSTPAKSAEQRQREEEAKRRQEAYARAQSENPTRRKTVNTVVEGQYRDRKTFGHICFPEDRSRKYSRDESEKREETCRKEELRS